MKSYCFIASFLVLGVLSRKAEASSPRLPVRVAPVVALKGESVAPKLEMLVQNAHVQRVQVRSSLLLEGRVFGKTRTHSMTIPKGTFRSSRPDVLPDKHMAFVAEPPQVVSLAMALEASPKLPPGVYAEALDIDVHMNDREGPVESRRYRHFEVTSSGDVNPMTPEQYELRVRPTYRTMHRGEMVLMRDGKSRMLSSTEVTTKAGGQDVGPAVQIESPPAIVSNGQADRSEENER